MTADSEGAAESSGSGSGKESKRSHWEGFWQEKSDVDEVYSNADRILRNLRKVTGLPGKRVLEIGAGTGRDSFPLAEEGAEVWQLDYAEHSLLILSRLAAERGIRTHVIGGDTFRLPFRDESFDIVFHQGLLEHFREPYAGRLLAENVRVLKASGYLLVDVPQRYHLYTLAKHLLMALDRWFAGWERSFSVGELKRDLRGVGLTVVHTYGEWMVPSFSYRALREILKKARLKLPLYPRIKPLSSLRARIRSLLLGSSLPLYTGISIGVIAQKTTTSKHA